MPRHRLEHYFTPSRVPLGWSGRSFLDLPRSVRELIYRYAGLGDTFIDLNYSNLKVYPTGTYPDTLHCRRLKPDDLYQRTIYFFSSPDSFDLKKIDVTDSEEAWEFASDAVEVRKFGASLWGTSHGVHQSMLLVSKQIHQEGEVFTYSRAVVRVCLGQPLGFARLLRMSDNALSNLDSLTIRLDLPKTVVSSETWATYPAPLSFLDLSTRAGGSVLESWTSTVDRLVDTIRPGQLRLRVVFHAKTMEDFRAIIDTMMRLPRLKDCGIYAELQGQNLWSKRDKWDRYSHDNYHDVLHINKDMEVSRLVDQIVRTLTAVDHEDQAPFRYLDLPQEIRFAILEYTDLLSSTAVQWRPCTWISCAQGLTCTDHGMYACPGSAHCTGSCRYFSDQDIDKNIGYECCNNCKPDDHSKICYCSTQGPISSSSCTCAFRRHALFSVSRLVRQDAISVYYSCNKIVVTPYNSPIIRLTGIYENTWFGTGVPALPKIELSLYLSCIARTALQHIRWLEWILPCSRRAYLLPNTPAWFDYLDTLLLMQHAMNLSALTLTINMSDPKQWFDRYPYDQPPAVPVRKEKARWYETTVSPVRALGEAGLKDFFVHLERWGVEEWSRARWEQKLERLVMGETYDSAKRGKREERMYVESQELCIRERLRCDREAAGATH